jgi:Type II secretion system (T2SS), protein E, N-terminal domain
MNRPAPLGQLLVQCGVLSESTLAELLEVQKTAQRRLGDLLAERKLVPPRQLAQILSYQLSCPWISLANVDIPRALVELLPREVAIAHTVVPVHLRETDGRRSLYVATHDPTDEAALAECARAAKTPVKPMVAITYEIRQALARYYGAPLPSLTTAPLPIHPASAPTVKSPRVVDAPPPPPPPPPPASHLRPSVRPTLPPPVSEPPMTRATSPVSEPPMTRATPPVALVLNVPDRFRAQCELAAARQGMDIVDGSLLNAAEIAKWCRPAAIVVTDDIYAFDRSGLNRLAIESDSLLVVWSDDVEAHQLEPLLSGAIKRARQPLAAPPQSRNARSSTPAGPLA